MNERIHHVLEFDKIVKRLCAHTETTLGKERAQRIKPYTEIEKVNEKQSETDEIVHILRLNKNIPLGGIFDIRSSLKRSSIGGVLNAEECIQVASTIYGGRQTKNAIESLEIDIPLLKGLAEKIKSLRPLEQHITRCIDDQGDIKDEASSKLKNIRSAIRSYESRIRQKLNELTRLRSKMLSDAIVTIRNDRYVIPVKQEYRATIGGIVHDQSASGQTLFMEPRIVVELNNKMREGKMEEKREIERILTELTQRIAEHRLELEQNIDILAKIDFIHARGKLAQEMRASRPTMNHHGFIRMKQARHPLIKMEEVVANDIEIGKEFTSIVITGPNTGGKTVTLKMVGLFTLMAQAGLQVPALDGCELAVFNHVYADIGDEQSIEQNLSTFSSHMKNIVQIMEDMDEQSLVLFDELGAGTDPQEGAALAIAILDEAVSRGARVIATTHYPELKAYGYNREQVINASMEFDVETLQPTYRLLIGVPGKSNAFDISQRLGLSEHIIERAKSHIGTDSKSVEQMISSLEQSNIQAEKDYEQAHRILLESEQLLHELKQAVVIFEQKRESLFKIAEEKAQKAIEKAREEAEIIVEELRNMKSHAQIKEHKWIEAKKALDEAEPTLVKEKTASQTMTEQEDVELAIGDEVKLISLNQQGTIVEQLGKNEYFVQVGMMKLKVKRKDLMLVGKREQAYVNPVATVKGKQYHVKNELDLRGERFEDALLELEKYLDDALLAGYDQVYIIHGKGTGALRKGVHDFAKSHPSIDSYRSGKINEGGNGVTVLTLK
ncbi:DNA mismatch repair protein MutS2 [Cerasibacillus quisquiliarum]|uniref:Endonuclease MutS2 n=1 Tax=Cerasibacillus quisquiliarum TaxID=227865 RepID=A0A511V0D3_9BACI|nr:endonuclease MutS2 [Cerasibacillus quisquiliarum]MBB5145677.1 DNA mismatch repair protein MutS2 [Cerasibacillus quisquiliarum]GEN31471.1 endonuclease MutS2 [Cerasibacillus quisquiliarum]